MITRRWILGAAAAAVAGAAVKAGAEETPARTVFLTSDDGPNEATGAIIDIAERQQIPVTLFMIGRQLTDYSSGRHLLERARNSPWITIGNHSYSHCSGHYKLCYRDEGALVADFQKSDEDIGFTTRPVFARGPGRNVWRLPELKLDDHAIRPNEIALEEATYDQLFAEGHQLYGWDVEWRRRPHGIPRQSSRTMIELLTSPATHTRRPGKLVMLMHDNMVRTPNGAAELNRIIEGVKARGVGFGKIADY
jgi:peptidoglycan/xylan/chitin deacetylase (PgdA/CDA1 family)